MAVGDRAEYRLNNTSSGSPSVGDTPVASTQLGTSTTTIATPPSSYQYIVKQIIICNTDTVERLVSLSINTAATLSNRFVSALPIAANDTIVLDTALVVNGFASETIQGLADTASKVNVIVVGWYKQVS